MAALTRFFKNDNTNRTSSTTTPGAELTNYTIAWSDLTGAGFAADDDVFILVACKYTASGTNLNALFGVGFGTTYAGRTDDTNASCRLEPISTARGEQVMWIDRRTLVNNQNIYFTGGMSQVGTATYTEFHCLILKLTDLTSDDFAYAEATHSGNAPASYDTSGATITTPAAGNWLFFGVASWLIDSTSATWNIALSIGGSDLSEVQHQGVDTSDYYSRGTLAYASALGAGATCRVRYLASGQNDCIRTAIFGLRLDAFANAWGVHSTNTVTPTGVDTYIEFAGNGSFALSATGPLIILGWPIYTRSDQVSMPYGRIQVGGADWPTTNPVKAVQDNITGGKIAPLLMGYAASQGSGTLDIDLDIAENNTIASGPACTTQVAVAFSLELAAGAAAYTLDAESGSFSVAGTVAALEWDSILEAAPVSYAISGQDAALQFVRFIGADAASYNVTGQESSLQKWSILEGALGPFAISGQDVGLQSGRVLDTAPVSYVVSGQDATLLFTKLIAADTVDYNVIGQAVSLQRGSILDAGLGSFGIFGQDASLQSGRILNAGLGNISINGADVTLVTGAFLSAEGGAYIIAGQSAEMLRSLIVVAAAGAVSVSGQDVELLTGKTLTVDSGSYAIAGTDIQGIRALIIPADSGAYAIIGQDAALVRGIALSADPGSYAIAGSAAELQYTPAGHFTLNADPGSFTVSGQSAEFLRNLILSAEPTSVSVSGQDVTLGKAFIIIVDFGIFTIAGSDIDILRNQVLQAELGTFDIAGTAAEFVRALFLEAVDGTYVVTGTGAELIYSGEILPPLSTIYLVGSNVILVNLSGEGEG